jgi:hypothetical protein
MELRLRRTAAQAMADGDWQKELQARQLLAQLMNPTDYRAQAAQGMGSLEAGAVAAGAELDRLGSGAKRLFGKALGDEAMVADSRAADAERMAAMAPVQEAHPLATTVGEMLPGMAIPGGAGRTLLGRALGAAAAGTGYELLGSGGDLTMSDAAKVGLLSAAGSAAGDVAGRALAGHSPTRVLSRAGPEHRRIVQEADQFGWATTPAERMDARNLRHIEAGWERNPYIGRAFDELRQGNQGKANRVALDAIGEVRAEKLTDDVLDDAHQRIGAEMRRAAGRTTVQLDNNVLNGLANLAADVKTTIASTNGDEINKMVDKFLDRMGKSGAMDVDEYLKQASDLATKGRDAYRAGKSDVSVAAYRMRELLDDAFERASGDLPELKAARSQWRALKELEAPGVVRQGDLSAPTLYNKLKRLQGGRVHGDRDLDTVARLGHTFGQQVPNSGTPTGMAGQAMLQGSPRSLIAAKIGDMMGNAYLSRLGSAAVTTPGLLGLPMSLTGMTGPVAQGLLDLVPRLTQRAGRTLGVEEATRPPAWGLPLF